MMAKPEIPAAAARFADAPCLEVRGLACRRGLRLLFRSLDMHLAGGQALALYGDNGSGKTSLLRQLAGLLPIEAGHVAAPACHYLGHADGLKAALTLAETLQFEAALHGAPIGAADPQDGLLAGLGLAGRAAQPVGDLSAGQRRRLGLARLLMAPRPLGLRDEPLTALDTQGIALIDQLARRHMAAGGLIVAASHVELAFATQTLSLADYRPEPAA